MAIKVNGQTVLDNGPVVYDSFNSVGLAGSVLSSTVTGIAWITPSGGSSVSVSDDTSTNTTYYVGYSTVTSGTITSFGISSTKLQFNPSTGTLSATVFTSLSDETQKTNIQVIENAVDMVKNLEGVTFNWKDNNQPSLGLIAQDVEKILPQAVNTDNEGIKSVNYGSLIGLLVEAIKEQQVHIEELEKKLNV